MSCYLGPVNGLIGLSCPAKQDRTGGLHYATAETVTGRRTAQAMVSRRVWSLELTGAAKPADLAALEAFTYGGFGRGPWCFVPPDAPYTNLVSPWDSMLGTTTHALSGAAPSGWVQAGARMMPDRSTVLPGVISRVSQAATGGILLNPSGAIPLNPAGGPITVSAWVSGLDANAGFGVRANNNTDPGSGTLLVRSGSPGIEVLTRQTVTVSTFPAGTTGIEVYLNGASSGCGGFQVTWAAAGRTYVMGRGCASAVLDQAPISAVMATSDVQYDTGSFVVTEVG